MTHGFLRALFFLGQSTTSSNMCSSGSIQHRVSSLLCTASLPLPSPSQTFGPGFPLGASSRAHMSGGPKARAHQHSALHGSGSMGAAEGLTLVPFLCQWPLQARKLNMVCPGEKFIFCLLLGLKLVLPDNEQLVS